MAARRSVRAGAAALALLAAACRSGGAGADYGLTTASAPDTVRGIVSIRGSEPLTTVVVTPVGSPGDPVAPRGTELALLRSVAGLEVVLAGRRSEDRVLEAGPRGAVAFDLERFLVRAADGQPARDGVLGEDAGRYDLIAADGTRTPIVALPPALQSQVGARIYLVGPPDRAPSSYGIIRAAR